jgi:hypothetical protein
MKTLTWFRGALAVAVLTAAPMALAADHLDSPAPSMDPAADITDVYGWVDGANIVLVLNVAPLADMNSKFSDKVQYVLHTASTDTFGTPGTAKDVICTFDSAQAIQCWVGEDDYATGDASKTDGLASEGGKFKVFAGLRDDPFYFNLDGFKDVVATVNAVKDTLVYDPAGCPTIDAATSTLLVTKLKTDPKSNPPGGAAKDFFAGANVLSIVLSIDKGLLNGGGSLLSVWGSTNTGG